MKITVLIKSEAAARQWLETDSLLPLVGDMAKLLGTDVRTIGNKYVFAFKSKSYIKKLKNRLEDADWYITKMKNGYLAQREQLVISVLERDKDSFAAAQTLTSFNKARTRQGYSRRPAPPKLQKA